MKFRKVPLILLSLPIIFNTSCRKGSTDECNSQKVMITQVGADQLQATMQNGLGPFSYEWSHDLGDFPTITVSESDTYEVTITDHQNNCTGSTFYMYSKPSGIGCGSFTAVSDHDNNLYDIVTIGTQCWMKSNVVIESGIQKITDQSEWANTTSPAWCYYNNDVNNGVKYGKLYNWFAVKSGNLCPQGWRIPSMADWETLITYLKKDSLASIALRKVDPLWQGNVHATDESGFSALPGGRRQADVFLFEGTEVDFWTTDEIAASGNAKAILLKGSYDGIIRFVWGKNHGLSCRCIKN